jgi:hypothetical protein
LVKKKGEKGEKEEEINKMPTRFVPASNLCRVIYRRIVNVCFNHHPIHRAGRWPPPDIYRLDGQRRTHANDKERESTPPLYPLLMER